MKSILFILLLILCKFNYAQDCNNIVDVHDSIVRTEFRAYVINCQEIVVDTIYRILPEKGSKYDHCYKLYDKEKNWLVSERWTSNDTTYVRSYYPSGKLRSKSYFYDYLNSADVYYYENGQIKYGGIHRIDTLHKREAFYKDGSIRYQDYSFAGSIYDSSITYFQNGQISQKTYFTPFDTSLLGNLNYKQTEVLAEYYFNQEGDTIPYPLNEKRNVNYLNLRMLDTNAYPISGNIYSFYQIHKQKGYDYNMSALKKSIKKNLKIPKTYTCPVFYFDLALIILDDGKIQLLSHTLKRPTLTKALENAISKIGRWEIGKVNGSKVNTHVYINVLIER